MNSRVKKHIARQLAKRTPEQIAADIAKLKEIRDALAKIVEEGRKQ